jgi:ketosteroid isomerase-like protein
MWAPFDPRLLLATTVDPLTVLATTVDPLTAGLITAVRDGGRMRGTDSEVRNRFFHAWTFRDGKVVHISAHLDRSRALEAAGLSE